MDVKRSYKWAGRIGGVWLLMLASLGPAAAATNQYPGLSGMAWTNGQFQFTLSGTAGTPYVIESSQDLMNWQPVVTNNDLTNSRVIHFASLQNLNFFRAMALPSPQLHFVLGARGNISLNSYGTITDSYNSADTNLSTGGQYDPTKTSTNGGILSVEGVISLGNHLVNGDVYLGASATLSTGSSVVTGTIYDDINVYFSDVSLPTNNWISASLTNGIYDFTSSGNYSIYGNYPIVVEAGVTVNLNVTNTATFQPTSLQIHGGTTNSGSAFFYLNGPPSAAPVANMAADASGQAQNLAYYGLPSLTTISFGRVSSAFTGIVYAPEAALTFDYGGSNGNLIGSFVGNTITVNGHLFFHLDENLAESLTVP